MSGKRKRMGVFNLKFKEADGTNKRVDFGAMFDSPWEGNYGCALSLPTGEKDERGYDIRIPIVAIKSAPTADNPEGLKMDISDAFVNYVAFEEMAAKPPRED